MFGDAAAFDTRVDMAVVLSGRASKGIAHRLRQHGATLVCDPESFFVTKDNHLEPMEAERAKNWARTSPSCSTRRSPGRDPRHSLGIGDGDGRVARHDRRVVRIREYEIERHVAGRSAVVEHGERNGRGGLARGEERQSSRPAGSRYRQPPTRRPSRHRPSPCSRSVASTSPSPSRDRGCRCLR